jgi:hypothetical protein
MQLASRLRETTLGDLLATLHRAGANGVLELIEPHARHAIHLRRGFVQAVESDAAAVRLGDVVMRARGVARPVVERARLIAHARRIRIGQALVRERVITPLDLDEMLAVQRRERLERLYALADAEVRFRVARPLPAGASEQTPLSPRDVFHGRPRRRARAGNDARDTTGYVPFARPRATPADPRAPWLAVLGLASGATPEQIRAAYKRMVLALHPDRAPETSEADRAARARKLVAVVEAYRKLNG